MKNKCILFVIHVCFLITKEYIGSHITEKTISDTNKIINIDIPDDAYDMHTTEGHLLGRDMKHFIEKGCILTNQIKELNDQYYKLLLDMF